MTREQASRDILGAVDQYDEGRLTRASVVEIVQRAMKELAEAEYAHGYQRGVDDADSDEEIEIELDDVDFNLDDDPEGDERTL